MEPEKLTVEQRTDEWVTAFLAEYRSDQAAHRRRRRLIVPGEGRLAGDGPTAAPTSRAVTLPELATLVEPQSRHPTAGGETKARHRSADAKPPRGADLTGGWLRLSSEGLTLQAGARPFGAIEQVSEGVAGPRGSDRVGG